MKNFFLTTATAILFAGSAVAQTAMVTRPIQALARPGPKALNGQPFLVFTPFGSVVIVCAEKPLDPDAVPVMAAPGTTPFAIVVDGGVRIIGGPASGECELRAAPVE